MNIAIFGATSQIAKDLIESFANKTSYQCTLFARDVNVVQAWLNKVGIYRYYRTSDYSYFSTDDHYDVIINFVGVGNPAQAKDMGSAIFDVTYFYDMMILDYLKVHTESKYLFLSSGAVYGGNFENPATSETASSIPINNLNKTHWYTIAKLYAEARHRALPEYAIVDIRVFNYFSHTQNMSANFFVTELVRALQKKETFKTSTDNIVRDFITPLDFFNLIHSVLKAGHINMPVDCFTKAPVSKFELLKELGQKFGLNHELHDVLNTVNATGLKINYYSMNKIAQQFGYEPQVSSMNGIVDEIEGVKKSE